MNWVVNEATSRAEVETVSLINIEAKITVRNPSKPLVIFIIVVLLLLLLFPFLLLSLLHFLNHEAIEIYNLPALEFFFLSSNKIVLKISSDLVFQFFYLRTLKTPRSNPIFPVNMVESRWVPLIFAATQL